MPRATALLASWQMRSLTGNPKVNERFGRTIATTGAADIATRIKRTADGYDYEADPKHRRLIFECLGLDNGASAIVPTPLMRASLKTAA